ncbi:MULTISPECIES: SusC/RagA family TonB-linked outer membrane protein [unclassified Sphingobacterium]|uniref:SusC/RagA family TonB-linked outer membrane protein n=1 Tax=unclassified Sphingobacterium TaxID=2609468 RepID=UPI0025DBDC17|nr:MULTISPECIES: SusC/RagA family TonB-linked outer membrane protein [unclassified Sphingobacterium]
MKAIFYILFVGFLLFSENAYAQKITLHEDNSTLKEILDNITNQIPYKVFYSSEIIKKSKKVSIHVTNQDLIPVLNKIFETQPFSYSITNNTIVLTPFKNKVREISITFRDISFQQPSREEKYSLVYGLVQDSLGKPMVGVNVINSRDPKNSMTVTDKHGRFTISATSGDILTISSLGFKERTFCCQEEDKVIIEMSESVIQISDVTIEVEIKKKLNLNTQIDLSNRSYMNLAQVLQGTVPGMTLQFLPSNKKKIEGINYGARDPNQPGLVISKIYYTVDQFLKRFHPNGQQILDALQNGGSLPLDMDRSRFELVYSTSSGIQLVPELRGAANFGNTEGMMVIIDGFPLDEFPANYPMANVESVEVIKDPKELIKWGPRGSAGIIMVKTNAAKVNKLNINYSMNMYYTPAPKFDRNKLQLPSSPNIIDYLRDLVDSNMVAGEATSENMNFAERVVRKYKSGQLTEQEYIRQMDSLSNLDNQDQISLLRQNAVSQNHMLTVAGGTNHYRFNVTGIYNNMRNNGLNNKNETYGLDVKNIFNFLKNKLRADWQINISSGRAQTGGDNLSVFDLPPPYQMLLDKNGNYIYDYRSIGAEYNSLIQKAGYLNHGVNILEDARLKSNITRTLQKQTRFNMRWEMAKGLMMNNSFFYRDVTNNNELNKNEALSEVRQLINNYGVPNANGVDFYVPRGNIVLRNKTLSRQWNLRSGLNYNLTLKEHTLDINLGGGGANDIYLRPSGNTIFGYNNKTKYGSAVFLPGGNPFGGIRNYRQLYSNISTELYPYTLLTSTGGDSTSAPTLNWNAGLNYGFLDKTITLNGTYSQSLSSGYGQGSYAKSTIYNGELAWRIKAKRIGPIRISTGIEGNKMPDLPSNIQSNRSKQADWNNYAIWITNFIPVQQSGQSSTNIFQRVTFDLFKEKLKLSGTYNTQRMKGISTSGSLIDSTAFKTSRTIRYFSAAAEGSFRAATLLFNANYSRSPEGQQQFNGNVSYDIKRETYFHSDVISSLLIGGTIQDISSLQGLGLMMGTNVAQGGGFGMATNNSFNILPPKNKNMEGYFQLGLNQDKTRIDIRYYKRSIIGLSNNIPLPTDPSTGLNNQITYSNIVNEGIEFFVKSDLVRNRKFKYSIALNGAYNNNYVKEVPEVPFTTTDDYLRGYRSGYSTNNVWGYRWAGLDEKGNPQIYDSKGNKTANPEKSVLSESLVYMGVSRAPWTGALIQDMGYQNFFIRVTLMANSGGIMRRYIPAPSKEYDNSSLIANRWRKPGDEAYTDVPAIANESATALRGYLTRNSSNSIMSSDFVRLQEVMVGWSSPSNFWKSNYIKSMSVSLHLQNLAFWARNKYKLDVNVVDGTGRIGLPIPLQCGCSLNITF